MTFRRILALETTSPRGSVAVLDGETLLCHEVFLSDRSHNSRLFPPLEAALEAGGHRADAVIVGTGPGSYTGARIGIAAALGLAMAFELPLFGFSSLLALSSSEPDYAVVGDARRGAHYVALVRSGRVRQEPLVVNTRELGHWLEDFSRELPIFTPQEKPLPLPTGQLAEPRAADARLLAEWAGGLSTLEWTALEGSLVEPIYLGAPFVTMPPAKKTAALTSLSH